LLSGVTAVSVFAVIVFVLYRVSLYWPFQPDAAHPFGARPPVDEAILRDSVAALGRAFVSPNGYVLPFELASILLLAALIGSILIAWPKAEDDK
jgi:NADH-quinone oxidoreductase subunit J